jgi:hypothetical protein
MCEPRLVAGQVVGQLVQWPRLVSALKLRVSSRPRCRRFTSRACEKAKSFGNQFLTFSKAHHRVELKPGGFQALGHTAGLKLYYSLTLALGLGFGLATALTTLWYTLTLGLGLVVGGGGGLKRTGFKGLLKPGHHV